MNKIKLLVAPLLSVAFLASCGGNVPDPDPEPVVDHEVTEEEFNDACSFKGVQYVQNSLRAGSPKEGYYTETTILSPTVYYSLNEPDELNEGGFYEFYVRKNGIDDYDNAYRDSKDKDFAFDKATEDQFLIPQDKEFQVTYQLELYGVTYNNFTYDESKEAYVANTKIKDVGDISISLKFNDKKVVYFDLLFGEHDTQNEYAYEHITPDFPEPEPLQEVDYATFRAAVEDKYKIESINENYKGKIQHVFGVDHNQVKIDNYYKITGASNVGAPSFTYETKPDIGSIPCERILYPGLVDSWEHMKDVGGSVKYYTNNYVYSVTIDMGGDGTMGLSFNNDMAPIHLELLDTSGIGDNVDITYSA